MLPVYQPPKKEEVLLTWKDFYPIKPVEVIPLFPASQLSKIEFWKWKQNLCQKCEECESSFFWRDFEHGCEVSQVGKRWMAGTILRIFSPKLVNLFLQEHSSLAVLVFRLLNAMGRRVSSRLQPSWGRSRWTSWPRAPWTSTSTTWSTTSSTMLWTSPLGWRRSWEWWMRKILKRRTCTFNFLHRCQNFFRIFSISLQLWELSSPLSDPGLPIAPEASPTPQPATKSCYKNQLQVCLSRPLLWCIISEPTLKSGLVHWSSWEG